jgi:two-component system, OmpR family, sensor histidine kinase KdpD
MMTSELRRLGLALATVGGLTALLRAGPHLTNPTIAAMSYLLVVLLIATTASRLWVAVVAALVADGCLNYFFMPPFGTFTIADPQDWVALVVFLAVSLIASTLSAAARARALAQQREELQSTLLASIGHDLRTPLTAIRLAADNLTGGWLGPDERREQGDLLQHEADRLARVVENVLEMARLDAGAVTARRQWVAPLEVVQAARDLVEPDLARHRVVVRASSDRLVFLDPRLTASAIARLLENAARYAPPDTSIELELDVTGEGLVASVRDHGPGFATADVRRLFDRFARGQSSAPGTGLGLSIARGLLAAEDARITAVNAPDGGARVDVVVPGPSRAPASAGGRP